LPEATSRAIRRKVPGGESIDVGTKQLLLTLVAAAVVLTVGPQEGSARPLTVTLHRDAGTEHAAWPPRGSSTVDLQLGDVTSHWVLMPEGSETVKLGVGGSAPLNALQLPDVTVSAGVTTPVGSADDAEYLGSVHWEISRFARGGLIASYRPDGTHKIEASVSMDLFAN